MNYYEDSVVLDVPPSTNATFAVFSANGLYDPYITGTGHQPIGFDQLMGVMYDHGVVIKCYIEATFHNTDNVNTQWGMIMLKDNASPTVDREQIMENAGMKRVMLGQNGTASAIKKLTYQVTPHKFLGIKNPLDSHDLRNDVTSNPSEQVFFHVGVSPIGSNDCAPVNVTVFLKYIVILVEPKKLPTS